jgi:4-hydroxy-tetrahydrodipicolinate reductase
MNITLIGYGKMGKEVERLAAERGCAVVGRVSSSSPPLSEESIRQTDVVIHTATPSCVKEHVEEWAARGKNIVVGTTGWYHELPSIQTLVARHNIGLVYASNFSIGVNILFNIIAEAATLIDRFEEYDAFIHEVHHKGKLDSPSGTALTLGTILLSRVRRKKELLTKAPDGAIKADQLHISSSRAGTVVGTHRITFDSAADSIEIVHSAKNRSGFALGALLAAEWIVGKRGVFTMEDVFRDLFQQNASPTS